MEIKAVEREEEEGEVIDLSLPENVLIEVIALDEEKTYPTRTDAWRRFSIEQCGVIDGDPRIMGAASYEACYGGFLDYTIEDLIDPPGEGWFVVEGITGAYFKGEWGFTDDDMEFYPGAVRPATEKEVKDFLGD